MGGRDDKRGRITGGNRGIGVAAALRLIAEGAGVAVTGTNAPFVAPSGADLTTEEIAPS